MDLDLNSNVLPTGRSLGVQWKMNGDMFTFKMTPRDKPFTRREILSVTSSIYDPLGMVSPIILPAKRLLQDLCKQGFGWDEEIEAQESQSFETMVVRFTFTFKCYIAKTLKAGSLIECRFGPIQPPFSNTSRTKTNDSTRLWPIG